MKNNGKNLNDKDIQKHLEPIRENFLKKIKEMNMPLTETANDQDERHEIPGKLSCVQIVFLILFILGMIGLCILAWHWIFS